jgi:predicted DNA-binding protein
MSTRSVRLDEETDEVLTRLSDSTGLSISEILKRGVRAYEAETFHEAARRPYDIYRRLELGNGGYAQAPARDAKSAIVEVVRGKHSR